MFAFMESHSIGIGHSLFWMVRRTEDCHAQHSRRECNLIPPPSHRLNPCFLFLLLGMGCCPGKPWPLGAG